jgi:signal transduction histidine kinase/ligand-binding sensor domain-containing protein
MAQFYHTAWTAKDGAPSQINALAQTQDGFLWIGCERGLFRFDGLQFEPYEPPAGVTLPSHNINSLMATPDGGMWISFNPSGLAFLKDKTLKVFVGAEAPDVEVVTFAQDFDGRLWGGTRKGLLLFDGTRWTDVKKDLNFPITGLWTMFVDRDGTLWVAADKTVLFLKRGSKAFEKTGLRVNGVPEIAQSQDGRLWMTEWLGFIRPAYGTSGQPILEQPQINIEATRFVFDRDGSLWMTEAANGLGRLRFPEQLANSKVPGDPKRESFKATNGLTDNAVGHVLEDREGNIWVGSNKGLDRFSYSHLVPVKLPSGYQDLTLVPGEKGSLWIGSGGPRPVLRLEGDDIVAVGSPKQLASVYYNSSSEIWWGGHGGIWRQREQVFDFFPEPKFADFEWFWELVASDQKGGLWAGVGDIGLLHFKDGIWGNRVRPPGLIERTPSASYRDSSGRIWFGYTENRVVMLDGERVQAYSQADGIDIGRIRVIRGNGSDFWFGGELGLALFNQGRFRTIRTRGEPFGTVSGIIQTADGGLWLNELHGVVHITPSEVRQIKEDPNHMVTYQLFDFRDGLPGAPQMNIRSSTAIEGTDGRLWFATDNGLAWIDPAHIALNMVPPPVFIRALYTPAQKYEPTQELHLPAGTVSLRLEYTALSLSIPERNRFRYKLDGWDKQWQEAGTRREAIYTNLKPGTYTFHVIASNNDGIWNEKGAVLNLIIAPSWYQTNTFMALCIAAGLFVVWTLYQLRVQQIARVLSARFDERLAERTRLARELHDTFLQTIQGSKMVADDALEQPNDGAYMRNALERLSRWLAQATDEGRAALNSLRSSTIQGNDLAEGLRQATRDGLMPASMTVDFLVVGTPMEMHPIVRDEVYRIGYEAIHNAAIHSGAKRLEVELNYGHDLSVRVKDDGVGIDPAIVEQGKAGHFGLQGMRERAARIGGNLTVSSSADSGTEITIVVPGRIVFRKNTSTLFAKIRDLYRRKRYTSHSH